MVASKGITANPQRKDHNDFHLPQSTHTHLAAAQAKGADEIAIAVVGAHLSGMPLNGELVPRHSDYDSLGVTG
jgi:hypothetical protein